MVRVICMSTVKRGHALLWGHRFLFEERGHALLWDMASLLVRGEGSIAQDEGHRRIWPSSCDAVVHGRAQRAAMGHMC